MKNSIFNWMYEHDMKMQNAKNISPKNRMDCRRNGKVFAG
jgi:hypothetical protein